MGGREGEGEGVGVREGVGEGVGGREGEGEGVGEVIGLGLLFKSTLTVTLGYSPPVTNNKTKDNNTARSITQQEPITTNTTDTFLL